jgi:hypothetical protein
MDHLGNVEASLQGLDRACEVRVYVAARSGLGMLALVPIFTETEFTGESHAQ